MVESREAWLIRTAIHQVVAALEAAGQVNPEADLAWGHQGEATYHLKAAKEHLEILQRDYYPIRHSEPPRKEGDHDKP